MFVSTLGVENEECRVGRVVGGICGGGGGGVEDR